MHLFMKPYGSTYWQSQRDVLYDLYINQKLSLNAIAQRYGVWATTIGDAMKTVGIPTRTVGNSSRINAKYQVDSHYFDKIDTAEKAYIVGFILSDGHVSSRNHLMISVLQTDVDVLYKVRSALNCDAPITTNRNKYASFVVCSKLLCDALRNIGFSNKKTYDLDITQVLSHIPSRYQRDFLRGMFDGDGSIRIYKYPYFKRHTYHLGFTGLKCVCDYVKEAFM